MAVRRLAAEAAQPENFAWESENEAWAETQIAKYPEGREQSAVIPLLWRVQEQDGWVSEPAMRAIAKRLTMPYIRVYEVATFYTMFDLEPKGRHVVQVCGASPCRLRGAGDLIDVCKKRFGAQETIAEDGDFTWREVECIGACSNAPVVWVGKDYFEDLTVADFENLLDDLKAGRAVKPGSAAGRHRSEPKDAVKTLQDPSLYDGSKAEPIKLPNLPSNGPVREDDAPTKKAAAPEKPEDDTRPTLDDPRRPGPTEEGADDLSEILGVGPKIVEMLHSVGVRTFRQVADLTPDNIAWLDAYFRLRGRIAREDWVRQAKRLAAKSSAS